VLNDDNNAFVAKEVATKLDSIYDSIDTDETRALEEYLTLTKKDNKLAFIASHRDIDWSIGVPNKDNTYSAKAVQAIIRDIRSKTEFEENTFEFDLVKAEQLLEEEKRLKSECKKDADALHLLTKKTIEENLNTEDAINILQQKWIAPVVKNLAAMPDSVVLDLCTSVKALIDKYATTMVETEQSINETERELNKMLSNLVGNDFDMKGIGEIQKLFNHNDYE
jgi:type I restriction enzyme M protein